MTAADESYVAAVIAKVRTARCDASSELGSGVVVRPSREASILYVFTALHCLRGKRDEDGRYPYSLQDVEAVDVGLIVGGGERPTTTIRVGAQSIIEDPERDIAILMLESGCDEVAVPPPMIELHHRAEPAERGLFASGYPGFNGGRRYLLRFQWAQGSQQPQFDIECLTPFVGESGAADVEGFSGAGVFVDGRSPELLGVVSQVTSNSSGAVVANRFRGSRLETSRLNRLLRSRGEQLPRISGGSRDRYRLQDQNALVDFERVEFGGVEIDLWRAVDRLKEDLRDDWFRDPLGYRDLLKTSSLVSLLVDRFSNGQSYDAAPAKTVLIPKKGYTTRPAHLTPLVDRLIYQALVDVLALALDSRLSNCVYSFRYNTDERAKSSKLFFYSIEQWRKFLHQLESDLGEERPFLVSADISQYFDHINHAKLRQLLGDMLDDAAGGAGSAAAAHVKALAMLEKLLSGWMPTAELHLGIPQNRDPSSLLANAMLHPVDLAMTADDGPGSYRYYRYMDDIRLVCTTHRQAQRALMDLSRELGRYGLRLNAAKTKILDWRGQSDEVRKLLPAHDARLEQIDSFLNSGTARGAQLGVQLTLRLFDEVVTARDTEVGLEERAFVFCIQRMSRFARQPFLANLIDWGMYVSRIVAELERQPWATVAFTNLLLSIPKAAFGSQDHEALKGLLLPLEDVIYDWQAYHLWLLLALHEHRDAQLLDGAAKLVRSGGEGAVGAVAGACIYAVSVDREAHWRAILESLNEGRFRDILCQRAAIISLRGVDADRIAWSGLPPELKFAHSRLSIEGSRQGFVARPPTIPLNQILRNLPAVVSGEF